MHEAESARPRDLLQVRRLGEVHRNRLRRALDHRVLEFDRERELVAVVRLEPRPFVAILDFNAPRDAQEALRRTLLHDAGLLHQKHERRGAAVHDGHLGRVQVDVGVVHAEAAQRGHQVLDGVDLDSFAHQARGGLGFADQVCSRRNVDRRCQVHAPENDAAVGRRLSQRHAHFLAGVQPDAGSAD